MTLISIVISAWIAFAIAAIGVEAVCRLFKIRQGRTRATLRLLPFLSLLIDLFFNTFSLGYWFNPLNCSSCMQKMILSLFFPELKGYLDSHEISLLKHLGSNIPQIASGVFYALFFAATLLFVVRFFVKGALLAQSLRKIKGTRVFRPLENRRLAEALRKCDVKLLATHEIKIPMVGYSKTIFIPSEVVLNYPQGEFEAIVAHELEHVIWKDPLVKSALQLISTLFWWVPTGQWQKRLELDQEIACDSSIVKYGLDAKPLASALYRVASSAKQKQQTILCYLSHPLLERMQAMLGTVSRPHLDRKSLIIIVSSALLLGACAFWF